MTDVQPVPAVLSTLDNLKMKLQHFMQQREQAQANFNQLIGAVAAAEMMIKVEEERLVKETQAEGEKDGKADDESA